MIFTNNGQELNNLNNDRQIFCNSVSQKIKKELTKHFGSDPSLRLNPFGDGWAYFEDIVPKILPLCFKTYQINFTTDNPHENQYYVNSGMWRVIGFNKKEKLDMGGIKRIFQNAISDDNLRKKDIDFNVRLFELNRTISIFCNQLEKKVVNDINNII